MKPFRQTSLCQIPKPLPLAHPRSCRSEASPPLPMPPWHRPHRREAGIPPPRERPLAARCTRRRPDWQGNSTGCRRRCATSTETVVKSWLQRFAFPNAPVPSSVPSMTAAAVPKPPQNSSAIPCSVPMIWSDACAWVPVCLYAT